MCVHGTAETLDGVFELPDTQTTKQTDVNETHWRKPKQQLFRWHDLVLLGLQDEPEPSRRTSSVALFGLAFLFVPTRNGIEIDCEKARMKGGEMGDGNQRYA